ncbi:MAG TPA: helix-turn-helix transcriptional regulator [Solirubrobacteraceae bacterium]
MDLPTEISRSAFGRAVASRRAELRLTQEALSLKSGQHQKWISNVETARINPSLSNLARLAASLEMRLSELIANAEAIDDEGPPSPASPKRHKESRRGRGAPAALTPG